MIKRTLLLFAISCMTITLHAQKVNLNEYDIFLGDTLINKTDFINNTKNLKGEALKRFTFKPIIDGKKKVYYLNGQLSGEGEIKNKKENGFWTYWHPNGQKAREGNFDEGKRTGTHSYWYPNGKLRGVGNFKNDKYDGKWTMHNEDGTETIEQFYKDGELVKEN